MNLAELKGEKVSYQIARRASKCSEVQDELDNILDEIDEDIVIAELEVGVGNLVKYLDEYVEHERRVELFERPRMDKEHERQQRKIIAWIIFVVSIGLLAVIAAGWGFISKGRLTMLDGIYIWASIGLIVFLGAILPVIQMFRYLWAERRYKRFKRRLWS